MQTNHETLLVISIIDSFCAQLKLFCETVISSEYLQVVLENTNFNLKIFGRVLRMLAHLGVRSYGPKHLPIPVTNLVYTPGYDHI